MPAPRSDLKLYRHFLPLLRPYRGRLLLALAAGTSRPLLSAARIWLLKVLIDAVLRQHQTGLLPLVAGGFVGIALVQGLIVHWDESLSGWVGTHVVRNLRVRLYAHLQSLSLRFYHEQRLGDLLTRLSGDIGAIEDLVVSGLTDLVAYGVTIVLFLGLLFYLDQTLVLVALSVLPVLVLITAEGARRGRRAQREIRERASQLTSRAEESLSAIALIKAFARGPYELAQFTVASERSADARLRAVRIRASFSPLTELVAAIGMVGVIWVGGQQVLAGHLSLGSLVVFISYLGSLYLPIQGLSRLTNVLQRALVGAERVAEVLEAPGVFSERSGGAELPPIHGQVDFSKVTFGYTANHPVLHDVSLRISPGEMVALIGASGAGKTTVVSLLLDYYDADAGAVCLDGQPLPRFDPDSVRRRVAAVLQEPMLFNTSVRENIRYGRLDASDAEIEAAAAVAQADAFIRELPAGYDSVVGPRGSRISGGQRQRLAIARALVKAVPVLVLDEATSALDPSTEAKVLGELRLASPDRAILLVSHRYSAVSCADRVVVLDGGRVIQEGRPDQLRSREGAYREFVRSQIGVAV